VTLTLLHQLAQLQHWAQQADMVGYFDDGYAASQLWKVDWEHYQGEQLAARARTVIARLDPLSVTTAEGANS